MLRLIHWIVDYKHEKGYRIDWPRGRNMVTLLLFHHPLRIWQDGRMIDVPENACIIYEKWVKQLYYNDEAAYTHDGVFLDGEEEEVAAFLRQLPLPLNQVIPLPNPKAISAGIRDIAAEALLREEFSPQILDCQLRHLFYKLADLLCHAQNYAHSDYARFEQLRREVLRRPEDDWETARVSRELHLSVSRFQHLYKRFFDASLMQDVIKARLEHAQYLLRDSRMTVAAVAAACGYASPEHFMRQFKQRTGLSPGRYRQEHMFGETSCEQTIWKG